MRTMRRDPSKGDRKEIQGISLKEADHRKLQSGHLSGSRFGGPAGRRRDDLGDRPRAIGYAQRHTTAVKMDRLGTLYRRLGVYQLGSVKDGKIDWGLFHAHFFWSSFRM